MKRRDLIRHLEQYGCYLDREGGRHSIYRNPQNGRAVGRASASGDQGNHGADDL